MTEKLTYDDLKFPNYRNTRQIFANLNVSDAVRAVEVAPLNLLVVGSKGTGKTQLVSDIYSYHFGGNKPEGGTGVFVRAHPEVDVYNEIFTQLNIKKAQREITDNIDAAIYWVEEINRAPEVAQNQFFGMGDGAMDCKGRKIKLGRDGYRLLVATANLGNGKYRGTFATDEAMLNRLHVTLDFDYKGLWPTDADEYEIEKSKANPNVKEAPARDISEKLIAASREVAETTVNPTLEEIAVVNYLKKGLVHCLKNGVKEEKVWPTDCQDCSHNSDKKAICSFISAPVRRTIEATRLYAAALNYIAKLKNPEQKIDTVDLMFKAFELTGAYQSLLNPAVLRADYREDAPKFMAEVAEALKQDFRANEDYILASLEEARKGNRVSSFFVKGNEVGNYDTLSKEAKKGTQKIEPFSDKRPVGLEWVKTCADFMAKEAQEKQK